MGQYDLPDSASLKRRLRAGEFSSEPARPEIPPEDRSFTARPQTQDNADFSFGDVAGDLLAAPFRGAEGAVRSAYGLLDAITFDSLPDYTENFTGHSKYIAGGILEGLTQFGVGFYALGGAVGAIGKGVEGAGFLVKEAATAAEFIGPGKMALSTAGNIARGVLTDFTVFDGQSGRLADLAAKVPGLEEPMNEYLSFALTNKDDSELEGRMKNALEGAGVGAAIDGIMHGVRWLRKIKEEQIKGVPVDEAVKAANKTVHIKDINTIFKQLDDMRFAEESPFKGPLLDDAVAKANAGEDVWLNADATPDPAYIPRNEVAYKRSLQIATGVERVGVQPGIRLIDTPRPEVEALFNRNINSIKPIATDVLGRKLGYDSAMVDNFVGLYRRLAGPEYEAANAQIEGVLSKLSARDRKKFDAIQKTGQSIDSIAEALRVKGGIATVEQRGDYQLRGAAETLAQRGNVIDPKLESKLFVTLADFKPAAGVLSKWELQNWVNKFGTMLDNPQTTIHLKDGKAEIGIHLSPEQAADDAMKKALEAFRCLGGV